MRRIHGLMAAVVLTAITLTLQPPPSGAMSTSNDYGTVSSALQFLPPIGAREIDPAVFDPSLTPYLKVSVWQIRASQANLLQELSGPAIQLRNRHYQVVWKAPERYLGQQLVISVGVPGLPVGSATHSVSGQRAVPIHFTLAPHPHIRAAVLYAEKESATAIAQAILGEFGVGAAQAAKILGDLILGEADQGFTTSEIAQALKTAFGTSAAQTVGILRGATNASPANLAAALVEVFGVDDATAVAQILKDTGVGAGGVQDALMARFQLDAPTAWAILGEVGFTSDEVFVGVSAPALAARFAPQLRFDGSAFNTAEASLPMSAQQYFEDHIDIDTPTWVDDGDPLENKDWTSLQGGNPPPTYYRAFRFGNQVRILYWWYYGFQPGCWDGDILGLEDVHDGDWERVMLVLKEDQSKVVAVTFFQDQGWYTRLSDGADHLTFAGASYGPGLQFEEDHPLVYVGMGRHGAFHSEDGWSGSDPGNPGLGACGYSYDWHFNGSAEALRLHTQNNLVSLIRDPATGQWAEPWMHEEAGGTLTITGDGSTFAFDLPIRFASGVSTKIAGENTALTLGDGTGTGGLDQVIFDTAPPAGDEVAVTYTGGGFRWGCGPCEVHDPNDGAGISTHPLLETTQAKVGTLSACQGEDEILMGAADDSSGCFASQCRYHDNQSLQSLVYVGYCSHCPSGYTDMGLWCGKGTWPWEWSTTSITYYDPDYSIPTGDAGLSRTQ